jgi:hypothetical protein
MERGMAESIKSKGGTLTVDSQTPQSLNGVPCYLIQGQIALPTGKVIHVRNYVISANDKVYGLLLETLDESTDTELLTIANSFRFLSPPQLPDPMANSLSYKIGQVTGFFIFLLAAFCTIRFFARMITRASQRK